MFTEKYIALQPERRFTKNQLHEPIKFIPVEQLFRKIAIRLKDIDPKEKDYPGKHQQP